MTKNIFEEESTSETQASGGDAKIRKQARQLAYDVRYKVKQSLKKGEESNDASLKRAYLQQLNSSPAPGAVKRVAKTMLIGESYDFVDITETAKESVDKILSSVFVKKTELEDADGNSAFEVTDFVFGEEKSDREKKYKVRVTGKKGKKTYVRMADRKDIDKLRKGDEVSSVEMTGYGVPNEEKGKKKVVKKAKKDFDGDGKLESPEAEYKGSKDKAIKKAVAKEGYQRDPERLKKDKTHSKQPDPSKDGFTGIGNMSIKDIMKMNKKMKKEEVVAKESVGSAIDKGLGAVGDTAKVAGKTAVGTVKVAGKVAKGAAKAAATVVGTPIGVAKSIKKGFKSGTQSESVGSAVDKALGAVGDTAKVAGKTAVGTVKVAGKVAKGAAKAAGQIAGTPIGVAKSIKKGWKAGTASESIDPSVQSAVDALNTFDNLGGHQVDENRMASHTAGMSDAQKDAATSSVSRSTADKMGRRNDEDAFKGRKKKTSARYSSTGGKKRKNTTGRGQPEQYRKSADSSENEARFPYGRSKIVQGKGSFKGLNKEEVQSMLDYAWSLNLNEHHTKDANGKIIEHEDTTPSSVEEGVIDIVKKGAKRHAKAVEKKKIKNRKAVPYAALGASYQPEGEVLDELSKTTLGNYVKDASSDASMTAMDYGSKPLAKGADKKQKKVLKRLSGIRKATSRLDGTRDIITGKKSTSEEVVHEGIGRAIKKGVKIAKRVAKGFDPYDPGGYTSIGSLGNPHLGNEEKRKKERAAKRGVKEDYYSGTGEKVVARTKKWMDKKGQKGAPGLDAMKARSAEHKAKRGVKEDFVTEVIEDDNPDANVKKIDVMKGKNKVKINPNMGEQVENKVDDKNPDLAQKSKQANMLKKRVLMQKLKAVRSGAGDSIMASHTPQGEVVEAKQEQGRSDYGKASVRNKRAFGIEGEPEATSGSKERGKMIDARRYRHRTKRGIKKGDYKIDESHATAKKPSERAAIAKLEAILKRREDLKKQSKGVKEEVIPRGPGGNPIRIKDRIKAAKGFIPHKGKPTTKEEVDAYKYVVSKLKKKYGSGVLTKGDKIKPQSAADKAKARAHQAKVDAENAAERKKDPSQGRYPKGYSNRGSD